GTPSFAYRGQTMRNHNQLLGRVEGMDGIKTGYTQASGFNLVASVRRNNRHIVSVVMGGTSAGARDARMRSLIEEYIAAAAPQKSLVAEAAAAKAHAAATRPAEERAASVRSHVDSPRAGDTRPTSASGGAAIYSVASRGQSFAWPAPSVAVSAISPTVPVPPPATEPTSAATTAPTGAIPAPTAKLGT